MLFNVHYLLLPILLVGTVHAAFGDSGSTYDREIIGILPDGSNIVKHTFYPYERIHDGNAFERYIFSDTERSLVVETAHGSISLDKNTCGYSFFPGGVIEDEFPLFTDSIIARNAKDNTDRWSMLDGFNESSCVASWDGNSLVASRNVDGVGLVEYKYILNGDTWKTQLEVTNLSSLPSRFGFTQTLDLNRDTIQFGKNVRNLDQFDGITFDRKAIEKNQAKILNLLNDVVLDFDIGFDNLWSITVYDTGKHSTKLAFDYTRNSKTIMPGETLIIDPTFTDTSPSVIRVGSNSPSTGTCIGRTQNYDDTTEKINYGGGGFCTVPTYEFDVTSIPDVFDEITSGTVTYDIGTTTIAVNCVLRELDTQPSVGQTLYDESLSGDKIVTADNGCQSTGNGKTFAINSAGLTDIETKIAGGNDWYAFSFYTDPVTSPDATDSVLSDIQLELVYSMGPLPDAVDDLTSPSESFGSVTLSWTEPNLNGKTLSGYQINYTTPFGAPTTIITNDTGTNDTSSVVSGLAGSTDYSFRVGAWTTAGTNATSPPATILNVTTGGNFTIGTVILNQTNTETLPITFEEQSINSTAKFLNVTFANTYDMACDFHYKFANINQTYVNLTSYAVSTTLNETSFVFNNYDNEVIDVNCWDQTSGTDADYLLRQVQFELLDQIDAFRSGDYGTDGKIGVFDFITLGVIIISMIGLNRVNESVGAIFNVAFLGALAFFEIIEMPTVVFGLLAVVLVFIITSTRKI